MFSKNRSALLYSPSVNQSLCSRYATCNAYMFCVMLYNVQEFVDALVLFLLVALDKFVSTGSDLGVPFSNQLHWNYKVPLCVCCSRVHVAPRSSHAAK